MEKGSSVVIFGLGTIGMAVLSPFQKVLHLLFSVCFPRKHIHAPHQLSFGGGINRLQRERKCVVLLGLLVLEYFMAPCFLLHVSWLHVFFSIFHGSMFSCSM